MDCFHPISRVPTELVELIFLRAVHITQEELWNDDEVPLMEVTISHICSHWRHVALRCPKLWRSFANRPNQISRNTVERFEIYAQRSGSVPFQIRLRLAGIYYDPKQSIAREMVRKAILHVERWQHVKIEMVDKLSELQEHRSLLHDREAPFLEYIHLGLSPSYGSGERALDLENLEPQIFTIGCPNLAYLNLDNAGSAILLPPLQNLTSLDLTVFSRGECLCIPWTVFLAITKLPLTLLSVLDTAIMKRNDTWTEPIEMESLRHLRWADLHDHVGQQPFKSLFKNLRAPTLETLTLERIDLSRIDQVPLFPNLHTMYFIDSPQFTSELVTNIATSCPNLATVIVFKDEPGHTPIKPWFSLIPCKPQEIEPSPRGLTLKISSRIQLSWTRSARYKPSQVYSLPRLQHLVNVVPADPRKDYPRWPPRSYVAVPSYML
ncbi:hypothetical protein FA15DRAFT_676539 [Coprinopsis marcescibilis]|uniref:F-box domain-containing protein n=1 Tax=Coprinopsis marcescibilis TaxID=230819 RepID=A0A5C3KA28_COPMA|nr:hypothetical protein FA15DRAFT_676539 [Coprinopsis marcescibilis]